MSMLSGKLVAIVSVQDKMALTIALAKQGRRRTEEEFILTLRTWALSGHSNIFM